ncbi:MAG: hypothetical protein GSR86_02510 [Desulfurococcales archaeon]|nr:hypothetical protein [Desulfurococcales archaeon]
MTPRIRYLSTGSMIKLGIAAILTWLMFGGYILTRYLGVDLSPQTLVILMLATVLVFYTLLDNLHKKVEMIQQDYNDPLTIDLGELEEAENENAFLVWLLLDRIIRSMSTRRLAVTLHVVDEGIPILTYPPESSSIDIDLLEPNNNIKITDDNKSITITLPLETYSRLRDLIEDLDGEAIKIEDEETLNTIYNLINEISKELNKGASNIITHYITYKTLIKLIKQGTIIAPEKLIYEVPIQDELKNKILQQLREEKIL